jgi:hypothetical protein
MSKITRKRKCGFVVTASRNTKITRKSTNRVKASRRITASQEPGAWLVFEDPNGVLKKLYYSKNDYIDVGGGETAAREFEILNPDSKFKYFDYEDGWVDPTVKASRRITAAQTSGEWKTGTIDGYKYQAKVFPVGSDFGIGYDDGEDGRISKLWISKDGETLVNYDRGWDVLPDPDDDALMDVYYQILGLYNNEKSDGGEVLSSGRVDRTKSLVLAYSDGRDYELPEYGDEYNQATKYAQDVVSQTLKELRNKGYQVTGFVDQEYNEMRFEFTDIIYNVEDSYEVEEPDYANLQSDVGDLVQDLIGIYNQEVERRGAYGSTAITAAVPPIVLKIGKDILLGIAKDEVQKFLEGNPNSTIQNVIDYVIDSIFSGKNSEVKKDKGLFDAIKLDEGVIGGWLRAALEEIINSEFGDLVSDGVAGI